MKRSRECQSGAISVGASHYFPVVALCLSVCLLPWPNISLYSSSHSPAMVLLDWKRLNPINQTNGSTATWALSTPCHFTNSGHFGTSVKTSFAFIKTGKNSGRITFIAAFLGYLRPLKIRHPIKIMVNMLVHSQPSSFIQEKAGRLNEEKKTHF